MAEFPLPEIVVSQNSGKSLDMKWSVIRRLISYTKKHHTVEFVIKSAINTKIDWDPNESHPNFDIVSYCKSL